MGDSKKLKKVNELFSYYLNLQILKKYNIIKKHRVFTKVKAVVVF